MTDSDVYLDSSETRSPEERESDLIEQFRQHLSLAKEQSAYFAQTLKDIDPTTITRREDLSTIPVTRKSDLKTIQANIPPFGGLTTEPVGDLARVFASPGPIYEPQSSSGDFWRLKRAMYAAGVRRGSLVYNTFSYHFTPAGFMMDSGARALGCAVFPAGIGQTELQVQTINDLQPDVYVGTPSFLRILLEKAEEMEMKIDSFKKALVGGEALLPSARALFKEHGIDVLQSYATADLGLIAYETVADEGLIIDEETIVEIVRPGSNEAVSDGEVGEVVVSLFSKTYPLIRFGTGDLSMFIEGRSSCGRTNRRLKGWMGRADQTAKVKGMFVHPEQIDKVVKRHPEITFSRLVIEHDDGQNDVMTLHCETQQGSDELKDSIIQSLREVTKLRGAVLFGEPKSLARDGKVIDDQRKYD